MQNTDNRIIETPLGNIYLLKQLGKGKSGVSYLGVCNETKVVYKEMHYEPCPYYSFSGNKVKLEVDAYNCLKNCDIPIPDLLFHDAGKEYLVKAFIDGICGDEWAASGLHNDEIIEQLFNIYHHARTNNINIDYFPANFVISGGELFYIDYEVNPYSYEWGLEEWGIYYWANSEGMDAYMKYKEWNKINISADSGKPIRQPFEEKVAVWKNKFMISE